MLPLVRAIRIGIHKQSGSYTATQFSGAGTVIHMILCLRSFDIG